ncbi:YdcF family protein [Pseudoduganella sp. FT26W]|uniref:YdcF family protein n=1 Tax=Duganella aquatilis TaxID=2666082 RepID=A0A844D6L7_9BURK|nr:YdcF family protein [Duganella aquatilis]MRW83160.1 YdcF family protein [Duganella aquatilis]
MVKPIIRKTFIAVALLLAQQAHAAPVRDQQWSLLANQLFPALMDMGTAHINPPVLAERRTRLDACKQEPVCVINAGLWTDAEIDSFASAAGKAPASAWRKASMADDGVKTQVVRELRGLNSILQVYGLGNAPRYPLIDGPLDAAGSPRFVATVNEAVWLAKAGEDDPALPQDASIKLALALLDANDRQDSVAFEPLDTAHNAVALNRAKSIDWKLYRYSAIVVPGIGPETPLMPLSARGKLNVRMAAKRFADGEAPFIILSGASVHPRGTRFVEAVEMRRALIERFGVPAEAIIIEPYARHTTTNLRNITRRLAAMAAPLDKDTLVITNVGQSSYIESPDFSARNLKDLGYVPGTVGVRLSPNELTFRPSIKSLRVDPSDPLDP